LQAKTPTQYDELWQQLKIDYQEQAELLSYLEAEHHPKREEVAFAWTSEIRHFGHDVTSRIEGGHADIKKTLQKSTSDLLEVTTKIRNSLRVKRQDFEQAFAAARFWTPMDVSPVRVPIFTKRLNSLVTPHGLRKVAHQYNQAKNGEFDVVTLGDCSGSFTRVFGLSLKHEIACQVHFNKDWKL